MFDLIVALGIVRKMIPENELEEKHVPAFIAI